MLESGTAPGSFDKSFGCEENVGQSSCVVLENYHVKVFMESCLGDKCVVKS